MEESRVVYLKTPLNAKCVQAKNESNIPLPRCACNSFQLEAWYENQSGFKDVHNMYNLKS